MRFNLKFLIILGVIGIAFTQAAFACELRFAWGQWPPFHYRNQQGDLIGFDVELLKHISNKTDCTLIPMETRWPATLKRLKSGSLHVSVSMSYTQERAEYLHYSDPYRKETIGLFVSQKKQSSITYRSLEELSQSDFKLGVNQGYYYGKTFLKLQRQGVLTDNLQIAEGHISNIYNLREGQIDGFLMEIVTAFRLLKSTKLEDAIVLFPLTVNDSGVHFVFSKRSVDPHLVRQYNQELRKAKTDGTYDKLMTKYLPKLKAQYVAAP